MGDLKQASSELGIKGYAGETAHYRLQMQFGRNENASEN
jgi:hypothetical protein